MTTDSRHNSKSTGQDGFTLIEVMIVVAIIGILSALAIPSFKAYVYKSRAADGPVLLGAVAAHQEAYFSEFGRYFDGPTLGAGSSGYPGTGGWAPGQFTPDPSTTAGQLTAWPAAAPGFDPIGFRPDGPIRMGLITIAGPSGTEPGAYTPDDWFVVAAMADVDNDGSYMILEIGSQMSHVSVFTQDGDSHGVD